ncbi:hypothetical protein [Spirosoma aerophilum]
MSIKLSASIMLFLTANIYSFSQTFEYEIDEEFFNKMKISIANDSTSSDSIYLYMNKDKIKNIVQNVKLVDNGLNVKKYLVTEYFNFRYSNHKLLVDEINFKSLDINNLIITIKGTVIADRERWKASLVNLVPRLTWNPDGFKELINLNSELLLSMDGSIIGLPLRQVNLKFNILIKNLQGKYNLEPVKPNFALPLNSKSFQKVIHLSEMKKIRDESIFNDVAINSFKIASDDESIYFVFTLRGYH